MTTLFDIVRRVDLELINEGNGTTADPATITLGKRLTTTVFEAIAIYNTIDLYFIILFVFGRRRGLFFWSLVTSNTGIWILAIGYILIHSGLVPERMGPIVMILAGWTAMVMGQSLVLYSRLHLLTIPAKVLRTVLVVLIASSVALFLCAWIIVPAANVRSAHQHGFLLAYIVYDKMELTLFFLQELMLSAVYLWKCYKFWSKQELRAVERIRGMLFHLVSVNLFIAALNLTLLYLEYSEQHELHKSFKPWAYSVKLKAEIGILWKLVDLVAEVRQVEYHEQLTRQMEQEWTQTLDATVGPGHNVQGHRDPPVEMPEYLEAPIFKPPRAQSSTNSATEARNMEP